MQKWSLRCHPWTSFRMHATICEHPQEMMTLCVEREEREERKKKMDRDRQTEWKGDTWREDALIGVLREMVGSDGDQPMRHVCIQGAE